VLIVLANRHTALVMLAVGVLIGEFGACIYDIAQISLRQAVTPEHFLGRMNATMRFLVWGTIPIGSLIGAGLSEVIGVQETIWVSAILSLFAFLPVLISKVPRIQTIPTGEPEPSAA